MTPNHPDLVGSYFNTFRILSPTFARIMAEQNSRRLRTQKLESLDLTYPVWLFDPDQYSWPRKHASLLPNSHPAQITGFFPWPWEYGTDLRTYDDPIPSSVIPRAKQSLKELTSIEDLLTRLRYDDTFDADTFRVLYEDSGAEKGKAARDYSAWIWEASEDGFVAPSRILRIERKWDGVGFWDRTGLGIDIFKDLNTYRTTSYGFATLVHDDAELVFASGVQASDEGEGIRRAEFELFNYENEEDRVKRGIVYPERYIAPGDHGLTICRGPHFMSNKLLLIGTPLEGREWSEVEKYVNGQWNKPLL